MKEEIHELEINDTEINDTEINNINPETDNNVNNLEDNNSDTKKDSEKSGKRSKKSSKKATSTQFKLTISEKDERVQEVLSRVIGEGQRDDFVKEAIYYWDYILHRAPAFTSRYTYLDSNFILTDDERILHIPSNPPFEPKQDVERKPIKLTITISLDDTVMRDILDRVFMVQDFTREAIYYWDYILHHSSFHSRYIRLKPGTEKKFNGYGTTLNTSETQQINIGEQGVQAEVAYTKPFVNTNLNDISTQPVIDKEPTVVDEAAFTKEAIVNSDINSTEEPTVDSDEQPTFTRRRKKRNIDPVD